MPRRKSKKRPCRICRKWFTPDPRVGDRQKTCGDQECKRKWHTKKCAEWNRKNRNYAQENYFSDKLVLAVRQSDDSKSPSLAAATTNPPVPGPSTAQFPRLPRSLIQEAMGAQHLVIIEYITQQLFMLVQEVTSRQHIKNTGDSQQLSPRRC